MGVSQVLASIGLLVVVVLAVDMVADALHIRPWLRRRFAFRFRLRLQDRRRARRREQGRLRRDALDRVSTFSMPLPAANELPPSHRLEHDVVWEGNVARPARFDATHQALRNPGAAPHQHNRA